jgi:hypothetical protein
MHRSSEGVIVDPGKGSSMAQMNLVEIDTVSRPCHDNSEEVGVDERAKRCI